MKLAEAIKLGRSPLLFTTHPMDKRKKEALKLLLESAIRLETARKRSTRSVHTLLPGETYGGVS